MSLTTRTQQIADLTFPLVSAVAQTQQRKKYRSAACEAGSLVRTSGLLAAVAHWLAKGSKVAEAHWLILADHLRLTLQRLGLLSPSDTLDTLPAILRDCDNATYFTLTRQTLFVLTWLKRQSEVLIPSPDNSPPARAADLPGTPRFPIKAQRTALSWTQNHTCSNFAVAARYYVGKLAGEPTTDREKEEKRELHDLYLDDLLKERPPRDLAFYSRALDRRRAALQAAGARILRLTLRAPLLSGLGARGVRDFGFHYSEPYGYPAIPGSSLKGSASAFAHAHGEDGWQRAHLLRTDHDGPHAAGLFGGRWGAQDHETAIGAITFHDAWWVPSQGEHPFRSIDKKHEGRDIVTPHYMAWLEGRRDAPDGLESPVPVSFLNVPKDHVFEFALSGPQEWLDLAEDILFRAGKVEGTGAKTNLGYGRFARSTARPDQTRPTPAHQGFTQIVAAKTTASIPVPKPPKPIVTVQLTALNAKGKFKAEIKGDNVAPARDKGTATEWPNDATLASGQLWTAELLSDAYGNQIYRLLELQHST